jgi:hypothetical protein
MMAASKFGMSITTVVLLAAAAVGQAQQAQKSPQAANAGAATSIVAATPVQKPTATPSAAKSSADTDASDSGLSAALLKEARDDGYRPVTRGKATLYCKSEILVGSSFPVRTYYNSNRLKIVLQQAQDQRMQLGQMHGTGVQTH